MKDKGINRGLVQSFETSDRKTGADDAIFGFRKMFWTYLNKLQVPFYDTCCVDASDSPSPVRYNSTTGGFERFNGTDWVAADDTSQSLTATATAHAGGGQGSATQLTSGFTNVTTVATAADSVKLPAAVAGLGVTVKNNGAAALAIFPATGDTINGGSANASISIVPGGYATFVAIDTTNWETDTEIAAPNTGTAYLDTINEKTSTSGVTIDGALVKDGGISANSMFAGFFPTTAAQALSGAGAVNVTAYLTKYTSTGGAQALTIASGSQIGQRKKVSHVVDGGSGVLTGVFVGGTTITFTTVGEFADLIWTGTNWGVLELGNTATPGTPPSLA